MGLFLSESEFKDCEVIRPNICEEKKLTWIKGLMDWQDLDLSGILGLTALGFGGLGGDQKIAGMRRSGKCGMSRLKNEYLNPVINPIRVILSSSIPVQTRTKTNYFVRICTTLRDNGA